MYGPDCDPGGIMHQCLHLPDRWCPLGPPSSSTTPPVPAFRPRWSAAFADGSRRVSFVPWQQRGGIAGVCKATASRPSESFRYLPLDLPPPQNTKVVSSALAKSSKALADCPRDKRPEFAVIGRSNVGKSSLINCLTNNAKLARVSKEPGMTKLINHYIVNDGWYLVDLPGYGFAKTAGKTERAAWLRFTKDYFLNRDQLAHVLLLVDSSLPPQQVDAECANWLVECEVPFAIVFTKLDHGKKDGPPPAANIRAFKEMLAEHFEMLPWCFETSSKTGSGRSELLGYLSSVRQMYIASGG